MNIKYNSLQTHLNVVGFCPLNGIFEITDLVLSNYQKCLHYLFHTESDFGEF